MADFTQEEWDEVAPLDTSEVQSPEEKPYVEERGFLADTAVDFARGITRATELGGKALERVGFSNALDDYSVKLRENYLKQDESEYYGKEGWLKRGFGSAVESVPTSLAVIGGALINPLLGGAALAAIGAGTDQMAQDDYLKANPGDVEGAKIYGAKHGISEAGSELLSDAIPFVGKLFKFGGKAGVKSLSGIVGSMTAKEIGARVAASYAAEGSTELANSAYQASLANEAGVHDISPLEAMKETIAPVLFMGAGFSAATLGMTASDRAKVRAGLSQEAPAAYRAQMANAVAKSLEKKVGKEEAAKWKEVADYNIQNNLDIPISVTFDESFEAMESHKITKEQFNPLTATSQELDSFVTSELDSVNEDIAAKNPITVGENTIADRMADRIAGATDQELLQLRGETFDGYVEQGIMGQDHGTALDNLLAQRIADLQERMQSNEAERAIPRGYPASDTKGEVATTRGKGGSIAEALGVQPVVEEVVPEPKDPLALPTKGEGQVTKGSSSALAETLGVKPDTVVEEVVEKVSDPYSQKAEIGSKGGPVLSDSVSKHTAVLTSIKEDKAQVEEAQATETNLTKRQENKKVISDLQVEQDRAEAQLEAKVDFDTKIAKAEEARVATKAKIAEEAKVEEKLQTPQKALEDAVDKATAGDMEGGTADLVAFFKTQEGTKGISEEVLTETADVMIRENLPEAKEVIAGEVEKGASTVAATGGKGKGSKVIDWKDGGVLKKDGDTAIGEGVDGTAFRVERIYKDDAAGKTIFSVTLHKQDGAQAEELMEAPSAAKLKSNLEGMISSTKEVKEMKEETKSKKVAKTKEIKKAVAASKKVTGYEGRARTGTINGETVTFENIAKGKGKGWYVKGNPVNIGKSKVLAIAEVEKNGVPKSQAENEIASGIISRKDLIAEKQAEIDAKVIEPAEGKAKATTAKAPREVKDVRGILTGIKGKVGFTADWAIDRMLNNIDPKYLDELSFFIDDSIANPAQYESIKHTIRVKSDAKPKTILHEYIHAITARALYLDTKFAKDVKTLYDKFLDSRVSEDYAYGITNVHEFLAEAGSNQAFQDELKIIKGTREGSTLFSDLKALITRALSKVFNTKGLKDRSLLQDTLDSIFLDAGAFRELEAGDKNRIALGSQVTKAGNLTKFNYAPILSERKEAREQVAGKEARDKATAERKKVKSAKAPTVRKGDVITRKTSGVIEPAEAVATAPVTLDKAKLISSAEQSRTVKSKGADVWAKTKKTISKYLQSVSSALYDISPLLATKMKGFELKVNVAVRERLERGKPMLDELSKLKKDNFEEYTELTFYILNGEAKEVDRILAKHPTLKKGIDEVLKVNNELLGLSDSYGLSLKEEEWFYMHRSVKDMEGLSTYLSDAAKKKSGKDYGAMTDAIKEELVKNGEEASSTNVNEAVTEMLKSGRYPSYLKAPSAANARTISRINEDMFKFYDSVESSYIKNVIEMTEAIEARSMIGASNRKRWIKELDKTVAELDKTANVDEREKLKLNRDALISQIKDKEQELQGSIAAFLGGMEDIGHVEGDQVKSAIALIKARLQQKHMGKGMGYLRDLSLISAIGNPFSTITQVGDLPHIVYHRGLPSTLKALFGKKLYGIEDFDFSGYIRETQGASGLTNMLDKILKYTGFQKTDQFFKATAMQAALEEAKGMSLAEFEEKYSLDFLDKTTEIYNDIQKGEKTSNVASFVWGELSKRQPISASEMPMAYLQGGNGRIVYALKSYNIKALNSLRDDIVHNSKKYGKAKASAMTMYYISLLTMAGVGADELKNLVAGKGHEQLSDSILNNVGKIFFFGRYSQLNFGKSGPGDYVSDLLMPATGFADNVVVDLYTLANPDKDFKYKSLKEIPIVGKFFWNLSDAGQASSLYNERRGIQEDFKDVIRTKGSLKDVRARVNRYNKRAKKVEKADTINFIKSRKYYISEVRKERMENK